MKENFLIAVVLLAVSLTMACAGSSPPQQSTDNSPTGSEWAATFAADTPEMADGWTTPERLGFNVYGEWQDSAFITPDGNRIYFMYYPGDLLGDVLKGSFKDDVDIWYSDAPFSTKARETRFGLSDDIWTDGGVMVSDGDFYHHKNKPIPGDTSGLHHPHIWRNGEPLAFNTAEIPYDNPHYCAARDELWFDSNDKEIYVLKDAKNNRFTGAPQLAPLPINSFAPPVVESQPWLNDDCTIMFFSSSRGGTSAIYRSERTGDEWSAPALIVKSKLAVGEPTLTSDMNGMFFVQVMRSETGQFTAHVLYTERNT